jgi:hypothetical protein
MIEALGDHELSPGVPLGSGTALRRHDAPDARRRDVDPDLVQLTLDPPVAPHRVLPRHPPDEELGLKGDCLSLVDPMRPAPLTADELAVPASERVGRKQVGEALAQRSEPLDNREDKPLLPRRLRVGHLATQNGELLAQDKQLEILRARRPAREKHEPENRRRESVIRRTVTGPVWLPVVCRSVLAARGQFRGRLDAPSGSPARNRRQGPRGASRSRRPRRPLRSSDSRILAQD